MRRYSLTEKQRLAFEFIKSGLERDECPSFDEIRVHLGLRSKGGVHKIVTALVERGFLIRLPNRARSLALPGPDILEDSIALLVRFVLREEQGCRISKSEALRKIAKIVNYDPTPKAADWLEKVI